MNEHTRIEGFQQRLHACIGKGDSVRYTASRYNLDESCGLRLLV